MAGLENTYGGKSAGQFTISSDVVGMPFPGGSEPTFHLFIANASLRAYELYTLIMQDLKKSDGEKRIAEGYVKHLTGQVLKILRQALDRLWQVCLSRIQRIRKQGGDICTAQIGESDASNC